MPHLYRITDVMQILGIKKRATLYRWIGNGSLKAYRVGPENSKIPHYRVAEADLKAFIDSRAVTV